MPTINLLLSCLQVKRHFAVLVQWNGLFGELRNMNCQLKKKMVINVGVISISFAIFQHKTLPSYLTSCTMYLEESLGVCHTKLNIYCQHCERHATRVIEKIHTKTDFIIVEKCGEMRFLQQKIFLSWHSFNGASSCFQLTLLAATTTH